jgi:hypothetical protein
VLRGGGGDEPGGPGGRTAPGDQVPPDGGTEPGGPSELEARMARLEEEFDRLRTLERDKPDAFLELINGYTAFIQSAEGTEYAIKGRLALEPISRRYEESKSKSREERLAARFEAAVAYEKANPEAYGEIVSHYQLLASEATGTEYRLRAQKAAAAAVERRRNKATLLVAALRGKVGTAVEAGRFQEALGELAGFPAVYAPEVKDELLAIDAEVRAAIRTRCAAILAEAGRLEKAGRFADARAKALEARKLGLSELEKDIAAALEQIRLAEEKRDVKLSAKHCAEYTRLSEQLSAMVLAGRVAEAVAGREALRGKLPAGMAAQLEKDLKLLAECAAFHQGIRKRLEGLKPRSFSTRLPLGPSGHFLSYDRETDMVSFAFGPSDTRAALSEFQGEILVTLARRSAGGELSGAECRLAALYLLLCGVRPQVPELLKRARLEGVNVADLEAMQGKQEAPREKLARASWDQSVKPLIRTSYAYEDARKVLRALERFLVVHANTAFAAGKIKEIEEIKRRARQGL